MKGKFDIVLLVGPFESQTHNCQKIDRKRLRSAAEMEENEFRGFLEVFPVIRSRNYHVCIYVYINFLLLLFFCFILRSLVNIDVDLIPKPLISRRIGFKWSTLNFLTFSNQFVLLLQFSQTKDWDFKSLTYWWQGNVCLEILDCCNIFDSTLND